MTARVDTCAEDGSMHIALSGEIDLANAAAVEDELRAAISHQPSAVSVDLTDLTYMDSVGIRILFTLASRLKPLRIMLVEDSPLLRGRLENMLSQHAAFKVTGLAAAEAEAVEKLDSVPYDAIVVDVELRPGSGIGVIRQARARTPTVRVRP